MKKILSVTSIVVVMLSLVFVLFGCGEDADTDTDSNSDAGSDYSQSEEVEKTPDIVGTDVFDGNYFNEMLWGYFEADTYDESAGIDCAKEFGKDMKYQTMKFGETDRMCAVLPVTIQAGYYSHFISSFEYNNDVYFAYTPMGKAMYRKMYMEKYGDTTTEFIKVETALSLNVVELVFVDEDGLTFNDLYVYDINDFKLNLYDFDIDEKLNITMSEEPAFTYDIIHSGVRVVLSIDGVTRNYKPNGFEEMYFTGYPLNAANKYENLESIHFYDNSDSEDSSYKFGVELKLSDKDIIDPIVELDVSTGEFTVSWKSYYDPNSENYEEIKESGTIAGKVIPCDGNNVVDDFGCLLMIDGKLYRYQMSHQEYLERLHGQYEDYENLAASEVDKLDNARDNILKELEVAFNKAGIGVTIDFESGNVTMEATFLFATDSYDVSAVGKEYLDSFMKVYTDVVLGGEYSDYVSGIVVEGHTDTSGSYSYNMTLSKKRADAVANHCITKNPEIAKSVTSEGCSFDYPVYNDDGTVNMDKSRRVSFRFILSAKK